MFDQIRRFKLFTLCLLTILAAIFCSACFQLSPEEHNIDIFAMDTFMSVRAYTDDEDALGLVESEIERFERLFSVTRSDSDIARLNSDGAAIVDSDTALLISGALSLCERTGGALDVSVYPLVSLWGFTTGEYKIPMQSEIDEKIKFVNYKNVKLDGNSASISEGMQIDLGSVAKGYTSDRICAILRERGVGSAVVNLGGNVQTVGRRPDGRRWQVAIKNPFDTQSNLLIVEVEDCAVITSGNYERFFTGADGRNYCHIIDPKTGFPADNGIVSMTIIGKSGLTCDGLSTALFVMGEEKAVDFWRKSDDFEMIYVTSTGKIGVTEGISDACTNQSGLEMAVISRE